MVEKEEERIAIEVLTLTGSTSGRHRKVEPRASNTARLSAPISLHLPHLTTAQPHNLTTSTNLSKYRYPALPGTVSKLGLPAASRELGYERMADVPKERKSRGPQLDIFPLRLH
jgi:hypothetical protein